MTSCYEARSNYRLEKFCVLTDPARSLVLLCGSLAEFGHSFRSQGGKLRTLNIGHKRRRRVDFL